MKKVLFGLFALGLTTQLFAQIIKPEELSEVIVMAKNYKYLKSLDEVKEFFNNPNIESGPNFIEIKIRKGSSPSLGRPTITPLQQKIDFINQIN